MSDTDVRELERRLADGEQVLLELALAYARLDRHEDVVRLTGRAISYPTFVGEQSLVGQVREVHADSIRLLAIRFLDAKKDAYVKYLDSLSRRVPLTDVDPVEAANEIAFREGVEKRISENGGWVTTGGACDYCDDWDGEDRRCRCGNRRMTWTRDPYHTFLDPSFYAEAY